MFVLLSMTGYTASHSTARYKKIIGLLLSLLQFQHFQSETLWIVSLQYRRCAVGPRPTDADVMDVTRPCFVCSLAASEDLARHQILPGMISHYILSHLKARLGWLGVTWLALCSCFFIPETDIFLAVGLDKERGDQSSSRRPPMFAIRPAAPPLRPPQTLAAPSGAELSRAEPSRVYHCFTIFS